MPCSPIRVSRPHGRSWTKPAWAISRASRDLVVGGVGAAEREVLARAHREQRRVLERGRDHRAQRVQRSGRGRRRRRCVTRPAGDVVQPRHQRGQRRSCRSRWRRPARRSRPGATSRLTSRSTGVVGRRGSVKPTSLEPQVRRAARPSSRSPSTMSGSVSKISSDPVGGGHRLLGHRQDTPSEATGQTSDSIRVMNATSVPRVSRPLADGERAEAAARRSAARFGITSRKVQNRADSRTLLHRGRRSSLRRALVELVGRRSRPRPNDLITRMPTRALLDERGEVALLVLHPPGQPGVAPARSAARASTIGTRGDEHDQARAASTCAAAAR